jgi:hypothetical protein
VSGEQASVDHLVRLPFSCLSFLLDEASRGWQKLRFAEIAIFLKQIAVVQLRS